MRHHKAAFAALALALSQNACAATKPRAAEPVRPPAETGESARTVQYHAQDIVPIRARMKYTTLIVVPPTEKIMEAATGDKDFWIVDVVGSFCFVHPAKQGISSNLNLITDKGNIYSFTLQDVSGTSLAPDLKVMIEPCGPQSRPRMDLPSTSRPPRSSTCRSSLPRSRATSGRRWTSTRPLTRYRSSSTMSTRRTKLLSTSSPSTTTTSSPTSRTNAPEKFSVYDIKDGKPNLITYDLREGTYIIPIVLQNGYVQLGNKKMQFSRKG